MDFRRTVLGRLLALAAALLLAGVPIIGGDRLFGEEPQPEEPTTTSTVELLHRLERAEDELRYLRGRDEQRTIPSRDGYAQLIDQTSLRFVGPQSNLSGNDCCQCGLCDGPATVCQGNGGLCQLCEDKLSWNKGSWSIIPFGFLTGETIATSTGTNARPFILRLLPRAGTDLAGNQLDQSRFTVHGQTTALGLNFSGPSIGSMRLGGMILFNFLGDRPALNQATPFFLRGYGELANDRWRFRFGQQGDLFNPLDPNTVNFGGNKQAGNGGSFRGALRATRFIRPNERVEWTIDAALSQQAVNDFVVDPFVVGTDNGLPNLEGRIGVGLGSVSGGMRPLEMGISGVIGETRSIGFLQIVSDTWGVSLDARLTGKRMGVRAEFLVGEAIGTYNAGIGQSLNQETLLGIETYAGWAEWWLKLNECVTFHTGYGIDDPRNEDLGVIRADPFDPLSTPIAGQAARNEVFWANLIWDVSKQFDVGFEVAYRETDYIAPSVSNTGMIYHFRARLKF